jgi:hypothetical protein
MGDHVPDVMESDSRMKILIYSVLAGITAAAIAYFITDAIVSRDPGPRAGDMAYSRGGYKLVYYVTALAGGVVFLVVRGLLGARANKQWIKDNLGPAEARVVSDKKDS